jgi:predicted DNA-binding protein with PD1-like motif
MQSKLLADRDGLRTFALVMETGDETMSCLHRFTEQERLSAAQFSGIGAFSAATLNYFDWPQRKYMGNAVREQVEVASLIGDVAAGPDGKPTVHVHIVLGRRDGSALAGHLAEGHVRPTLEIVLTETPAHLRKVFDPESGLALIRPRV